MNQTPFIHTGARLRLIQDSTPVEIENNAGAVPNNPNVAQRCTFPNDPFVNGNFVAPQAGHYRFNTSAGIQGAGRVQVIIESEGQSHYGQEQGEFSQLVAQLDVTLYLEAGHEARRLIAYYADAPANLIEGPACNFYEIEYCGP